MQPIFVNLFKSRKISEIPVQINPQYSVIFIRGLSKFCRISKVVFLLFLAPAGGREAIILGAHFNLD